MSKTSTNTAAVPEAKGALDRFKFEVANELGVPLSDGYNGTPAGFENVCEDDNNVTKPYVLHAEANAITKIARSNNSSDGATMYVTASPCIECSKLIIQAGIKRVVYSEKYRLEDGIELLKRAGIEVVYVATSDELQATSKE